jgi:hypothetical protein
MDVPLETFRGILRELFSEVYAGPNRDYTWFIENEPGSGLFGTLSALSAEDVSRPSPSGSTIAAHTEHLRWSLALTNALVRGETPKQDWTESWRVRVVDEAAWDALRHDLMREYETLLATMEQQENFSDANLLTGAMALTPHAAYHLGAIRQLVSTLEPRAGVR